MKETNYKFSTAIAMVVGIVIGCGIEFKADDVLLAVNGSVALGVLGFIIVGVGVLFGALTISEYALQDEEQIGIIGYSKTALGDKFAYIVGWFTMSVYYPACIVVLAMVTGIYLEVLLGIDSKIFLTLATAVFIISTFAINILSPNAGGKLQVGITTIKVIPLIAIGLIGTLFFTGNTPAPTPEHINAVQASTAPLSALIAIAFAFDGWIAATNIAHELDSKKTLSRALAIGTTVIIILYVLYFYGITQVVDPIDIMALGDAHTDLAAERIFGPLGGHIITLFVVISVYGGLNGLTLSYLRQPRNFSRSGVIKNVFDDPSNDSGKRGIIACIGFVAFYFVFQQLLDYGIIYSNLDSPFDLSVLPIMINYVFYMILFIYVNKIVKHKSGKERAYFLIISVIASFIALLVIFGAMQVNGLPYFVFSVVLTLIGLPFYKKTADR